jgi:hypothetical protein
MLSSIKWVFPLDKFPIFDYDSFENKRGGKMETIKLTVDSRKRISLTKLLPEGKISSVRAYKEEERIILEPMVEIPAREVWLYENKAALKKVKTGLSQKGTIKRGSFTKYAK